MISPTYLKSRSRASRRLGLSALLALLTAIPADSASVLTQHNDLSRTGANTSETVLNTSNVNSNQFGRLFNRAVDGQIYAQVLYVPSLAIPGKGNPNVIFAATMHNSLYAFDADQPNASQPFWRVNFGPSILSSQIPGCDRDILPEVGILSTPVIDPSTNTIYAVAETYENNVAFFRLHALDMSTGQERPNSPVTIAGSVSGQGYGSANGTIAFNPFMHWQRTGLLLYNNTVYMGFGSHQDTQPYRGWLVAYNAATLAQTAIRCLSPNGPSAGVWQAGVAPAVDGAGNIYIQTGHGNLSGLSGGDFGISMVKLNSSTLQPLDFFSPSNQQPLSDDDNDFGSSGPLLIPGTQYAVGGGKDGKLFLIDTTNMGQYDVAQNHVPQYWQATYSEHDTGAGGIFGGNVWFNNTLYMWGRRDVLRAFSWNGSLFNTTPSSTSTFAVADGYSSEPALSVSANGAVPGTGILWAVTPNYGQSSGQNFPGTLHAFDAANVARELWNSGQNVGRDAMGSWSKWTAPTVANGKVYVATFDSGVQVYGILPSSAQIKSLGTLSNAAPVNLTSEGSADWIHWGDSSLARKAGVTPQISDVSYVGPVSHLYTADIRTVSWTDGSGIPTSTGNKNALVIYGSGFGQTFTLPADGQMRVVKIHAGGWSSGGKLTAHLSDASAPDYVETTVPIIGDFSRDFTLQYQAASPAQTLKISWIQTARAGGITLNSASLVTGQIIGSAGSSSAVNLTAEGVADWIHWGDLPLNRKVTATPLLSDAVPISSGNPVLYYGNDLRSISWSDGAPTAASGGSQSGAYINGTGNGFSLQVPAGTTARTLRLHLGGYYSSGRLTASLSDGSGTPYVDDAPFGSGQYIRDYVLTFRSAMAGQMLNVSWTMTGGSGNVTLNGAALQ